MFSIIKNKRGQALVELALILPLFLLLVLGIFQYGFVFHEYVSVSEAAREGARVAAVGGNNTRIQTRIDAVAPLLKNRAITVTYNPTTPTVDGVVTVTITADVPAAIPTIESWLPYPKTVNSQAVMRVEYINP